MSSKIWCKLLQAKNIRALKSVRRVIVGGSSFSEKLIHDLVQIFPNAQFQCSYGNTENDLLSTLGFLTPKGTSSGYPAKNVKLKVIIDFFIC